jgi:hypothetical protein
MREPLAADYLEAVERRCRRFQGTWDQGTSGSLAADAFRLLEERKRLVSTIAELEQHNAALRGAVETRIHAAEAACCEGEPLCQTIDTRGPLVDPERVIEDDDEAIEPACVDAMPAEAIEAAWATVQARHRELHAAIKADTAEDPQPARVFAADGPRDRFPTPAEEMLRTAIETVAQRRATYGPPADHFAITVALMNAAFGRKIARRIEAGRPPFAIDDWPIIMALDKIARDAGPAPTPDTPIDLAGYAATLAEVRGR